MQVLFRGNLIKMLIVSDIILGVRPVICGWQFAGWAFLWLLFLGGCESSAPSTEYLPEQLSTPAYSMKPMQFIYQEDSFLVEIPSSETVAATLAQAPHTYAYQGALPPNWKQEFYLQLLQEPSEEAIIGTVIGQLRQAAPASGDDAFVEWVVAFVQGAIRYDWQTYHRLDQSEIRYPYQTLHDGAGVCADKTILLARLLRVLGYDCVIFTYPNANHMALGLKVPHGYGDYGLDYAYVETTGYAPIGTIPDQFVGGIVLDRKPEVAAVGDKAGKTFRKIEQNRIQQAEWIERYGREYLFMDPAQRKLTRDMKDLGAEIDGLRAETRHCQGTLSPAEYAECKEKVDRLNQKVEAFNQMVKAFNALSGRVGNQV